MRSLTLTLLYCLLPSSPVTKRTQKTCTARDLSHLHQMMQLLQCLKEVLPHFEIACDYIVFTSCLHRVYIVFTSCLHRLTNSLTIQYFAKSMYNLLQKCWTPMKIHVFQKYCPPSPHFNVDCFGELFSSWICVKKPSLQFIQH